MLQPDTTQSQIRFFVGSKRGGVKHGYMSSLEDYAVILLSMLTPCYSRSLHFYAYQCSLSSGYSPSLSRFHRNRHPIHTTQTEEGPAEWAITVHFDSMLARRKLLPGQDRKSVCWIHGPFSTIASYGYFTANTMSKCIGSSLKASRINKWIFKAHSTRGAEASKASARGVPIDYILKAAQWKSESTFSRFYKRRIAPSIVPVMFQPCNKV